MLALILILILEEGEEGEREGGETNSSVAAEQYHSMIGYSVIDANRTLKSIHSIRN